MVVIPAICRGRERGHDPFAGDSVHFLNSVQSAVKVLSTNIKMM